jgi:hypothetical protein
MRTWHHLNRPTTKWRGWKGVDGRVKPGHDVGVAVGAGL